MRTSLLLTAAAAVLTATAAQPLAAPDPGGEPVGELLIRLKKLHRQAERATESYHGTAEELRAQRQDTRRIGQRLGAARADLEQGRHRAALIARAQYRSGIGLHPYLELLLSRDPQTALDQVHVLERSAGGQAAVLERLTHGEKRLDALHAKSRKALGRQRALAAKRREKRAEVEARLDKVEEMVTGLSNAELAALDRMEERGAVRAQRGLVGSGVLGDEGGGDSGGGGDGKNGGGEDSGGGGRSPSPAGARAVSYALDQVGKPYESAAEGPKAFDSSGLTRQAWLRGGKRIPRSGQQQWKRLPRVPLNRLRPGDVVVYHRDATHVALYLGSGKVVEAPRTGQRVRIAPIAVRPVRGAVRPG